MTRGETIEPLKSDASKKLAGALLAGALSLNCGAEVSRRAAQFVRDSGSALTVSSPILLNAIEAVYEIANEKQVVPFLAKHAPLCNALLLIVPHINEMFPDSKASLEIIADPEGEDRDYLAVNIPTAQAPEEAFPLWMAIQERMLNTIANCNGLLSVDLRFR